MGKFAKGDKVIKRETGKKGIIIDVIPPRRGRQMYTVSWGDSQADEFEVNLIIDCNIADPFQRAARGIFSSYADFSMINTTFKIQNSNNSTISSLKASKTLFRAYQFKPLLKFLNSPNRRLLVADEVGLGKTIEAGHIMLELKARRELNHVLIICPKSLQHKWKEELFNKFGLQFKIYENQKELINDMKEYRVGVQAIINYEKIRIKKSKEEEKKESLKKKERQNLNEFLSENDFNFSLVLCDEAHKLRNNNTQTYKGAEIIMSRTNASLFLTATPVMINTENLYNLLHLLDNTRYYEFQVFDNMLQQNKPFIEALSAVSRNESFEEIYRNLGSSEFYTKFSSDEKEIYSVPTTVENAFQDDLLYQEICKVLKGSDTYKSRARLQYLLSKMSVMNNIFSRTRKREVKTDMSQAERKPHVRRIDLYEEERREFDSVIQEYYDDNSYTDEWGEEVLTQGTTLGLVQKKRQIASSVYAYLNTEEDLDKGIDKYSNKSDAKVDELISIIEEVFKHGTKKIVIFAIFRKTLKYLQLRLKKLGYGTLLINGQIKNRSDILDEFKNNPNAHILLSSEVGSEGLDMQFCNSMINYDLPWNPMVVEQRIGRIDRFGQKSPVVNIYNMVVSDSIQEKIYMRLLDRIGIFKGTIGDMEAILDSPIKKGSNLTIQDVYNQMEKFFFTSKLTDEEENRKIKEIELAIANEKENIKHLEEGLNNAFTNDAYFKEEINRIQKTNSYVTENELKNYLKAIIDHDLSICGLTETSKGIYELVIPESHPKVLQNFLTKYQPNGEEYSTMFRKFKNDIENKTTLRLTFNQDIAYENPRLLFVNLYNPIILACLQSFKEKKEDIKTTFCFSVRSDNLLKKDETYYLAIYKIIENSKIHGQNKRIESLLPILFDVKNNKISENELLVDHVYSVSQNRGLEHNLDKKDIEDEMIQEMRYDLAETISLIKKNKINELKLEIESDKQRNSKQAKEYYDTMIKNQKKFIEKWENDIAWLYNDEKRERELRGAIRLAESKIKQFEKDKQERLKLINEPVVPEINEELVSLNLIKII